MIESQLELTALGWPTCLAPEMGLSVLGILNRVESQLELTGRRLHRAGKQLCCAPVLDCKYLHVFEKCYESTFPAKLTQATEVKLQGTAFITLPWQVQSKLQKVLVVYCSPVLKGKRHQVLVQ